MLIREGDGIFAAYGHPKGPGAYYAEVAAEQAATEAAAAQRQREEELATTARRQAALDGNDPAAWREALLETMDFAGMHTTFRSDMEATELRLAAAERYFYPEIVYEEPSTDLGEFVAGPRLAGTEYSRREGLVSQFVGPVVMYHEGRMSAELVLAA
jgi:hypothetical protein